MTNDERVYLHPLDARRERADKALAAAFPEFSRVAIQRSFDAGLVKRAGLRLSRDAVIVPGESLTFSFPAVRPPELRAVKIPLEILYEDKHLIAINKTAGMVVHPGAGTGEDTLVHALLAHCAGSLSGIGGVERPGIVHRLDRETSGVMLVAKTDEAHRALSVQFSERSLQKEYLALVQGVPPLLSGSITKAIGRNPQHRHKMTVREVGEGGRDAHTDWERVEAFGEQAALLRCTIHTGRTHQIRVHLKHLGHVIVGDDVYGWKPDPRIPTLKADRVMLHAEHLVLNHPASGRSMDLRAPLPLDFQSLLQTLRGKGVRMARTPGNVSVVKQPRVKSVEFGAPVKSVTEKGSTQKGSAKAPAKRRGLK
ncbi:MAG: RluA family pseudouridine synthase [Opitutaceae bacterium]|nr:RluA family pseudouridine synthase [Opitutaceae bacterium]